MTLVAPALAPAPAPVSAAEPRGRSMQALYADLQREVQALGLLRRRYGYYGVKLAAAPLVLAGFAAAVVLLGDTWWQLGVAAALGVVLAQIAFLGHEAAHRQIFASGPRSDRTAMLVVNLLSGMSYSWWAGKHTRHHGAPNVLGKDGDIESDVLAYHPDALAGRPRLGAWLARHQGYYFFALITLQGWVMHVNSLKHLVLRPKVRRRRAELALVVVRLGAYAGLLFAVLPPALAAAFVVVQVGVFGTYLAAAFAPNHIGMPLVPKGMTLDFLRRQVLMSRNIRGGRFVEVLLGGLNHQIEHHLFPTMSRPDLRRVRPLVRDFCARHGITYTETGLFQSYVSVARYLNRVGLGGRDVFVCPLVAQYRPVS